MPTDVARTLNFVNEQKDLKLTIKNKIMATLRNSVSLRPPGEERLT